MEEELQESSEPIDFAQIPGIVRRRRWQFLVPFFCGWVLVWGASWLIPSTYRSGTLILQAQVPEKTFPSKRIAYFSAMCTEVSRDGGLTWTKIPLKPGENGLNMEGGAAQLRDGDVAHDREQPGAQVGVRLIQVRLGQRALHAVLLEIFGLIGLVDKMRGGYKQVHLSTTQAHNSWPRDMKR